MAILNQEKSDLLGEIERLNQDLKELHNKYDLLLESSASFFFIFEDNQVIEFSPKAEENFVFASDFSEKTVEELMPIFQVDGEPSKKTWLQNRKAAEYGKGSPFEFELLDRNGKSFPVVVSISQIEESRFLAHLDLIQNSESIVGSANSVADNAPVFIRMTDTENKITYFNKGWLELLGSKTSDTYDQWIDLIHEEDKSTYLSGLDFAFTKKKKYEYSFRIKDTEGSYRWLLDSGVPRYSKSNKFIGFVAAAVDTTDRKDLEIETTREEAISASEKRIQESFDQAEMMALTTDVDGQIIFCNKEFTKALGINQSDILGTSLFEIFIPDPNIHINQNEYRKIAKSGHFSGSISGKFFNKQKEEVIMSFNVVILRDALNEVSGINLIGENITERRAIQKQLVKTNDQLEELFDNSYDLIQIFDHEGNFQFVNQAWIDKLGYSSKIDSLKFIDIVNPEQWKQTVQNLDKIIKGETVDRFETVFISDQGKNIFVSGRVNCSYSASGQVQFRGIFYDITERMRAEQAQSFYYKIAALNIDGMDLTSLYPSIYEELNKFLNIKNLYISFRDEKNKMSFPYWKSEFKEEKDLKSQKKVTEHLTEYTYESDKPVILYGDKIVEVIKSKPLQEFIPTVWLGVTITIGNEPVGVLSIHSYDDRSDFNHKDLELLYFVSSQISLSVERKRNEEKIGDQAARLKAIFESSSHQIWSVDKKLNLTSFNNNYASALLEFHKIKATLGEDFEQEKLKFEEQSNVVWEKNYLSAFNGKLINFQNHLKTNQDKDVWTEVYMNPINKADGTIQEVSVIANDITEKKNADNLLKESEAKFREIFESFQDVYFRCSLSGTITMISPSVEDIVNIQSHEILGDNINNYFTSDFSSDEIIRILYKKKALQNFEAILSSKRKKNNLDFLCNIRLIYRSGKPIAIEGVARDISQIKKTNKELKIAKEVAEKSLAVKEQFLANMSHEIRTPMNGIIGMIDLIGSTTLDREQFGYVDTIKKSSETLLDILNDILDLSKIEAGRMEMRYRPVKLLTTIQKLYDLYSQQARTNNTILKYHLEDGVPEVAMVDETRLLQVLSNLTSNAIKFSDEKGTISISLRIKERLKNKCVFKVQIKDEGIGIPKSQIKHLFINFNQLDNSSTKSYGGTGLGLAISKELVKSMGGEIGVASTPGLGSTFWFTFEADIPSSESKVKVAAAQKSGLIKKEFIKKTPYLLVTDDNKVNRTVAAQILRKSGCKVDTAESGQLAIDLVKVHRYDIIFMDIQMPKMDGIEAMKNIRALDQKNLPPIIAMTAYSMREDREKFISQGMDDYVAKPIKADILIAKVKEYISYNTQEIKEGKKPVASKELIINQSTLGQLIQYGGQELLDSVLIDFEKEAKQQISNCMAFLKANKIDEIRKELHTLKGSAGTLGIERLEKKTIHLEKQLKAEDTTGLAEQLEGIHAAYIEFQENYKKILQN